MALKTELGQRWPMIGLLDIFKETELRVNFTQVFHSPTVYENLDVPKTIKPPGRLFRPHPHRFAFPWGEGVKKACPTQHADHVIHATFQDSLDTFNRSLAELSQIFAV